MSADGIDPKGDELPALDLVDKPPTKKFTSALTKDARLVQGTVMALERLQGESILGLAEKYKLHPATVERRISAAQASGFLEHYSAAALEGLVPKALALYEHELDRGNLEAARDLLFGLGILSKDGKPPAFAKAANQPNEEITSLTLYRVRRREALKAVGATVLQNAVMDDPDAAS